jgi:hypothetical protein
VYELTTLNVYIAATMVLLAVAAEPVKKPDARLRALELR